MVKRDKGEEVGVTSRSHGTAISARVPYWAMEQRILSYQSITILIFDFDSTKGSHLIYTTPQPHRHSSGNGDP